MNRILKYPFIVISFVALIIVLIIQVNWLLETAKIKEQLFNEKANMVLTRTSEAFFADKKADHGEKITIGKNETHRIDSLLAHYMNFYNFHIDYYFELSPVPFSGTGHNFTYNGPPGQPACYQKNLEEAAGAGGLQLKLIFPEKEHYILEEMGLLFITSVVLILVVLILFWRTTLSLLKEKKISEHTRDFLDNMTHEFKTPLTNIALAGKMIVKESVIKQEDKLKHYSGIILEENEKLRLQVEQVLSMTALERGEIPLQKAELDAHQLILDALQSMNIQIEHRNGSLNLTLDAIHFMIMGDKTHLTNAFCNLIDNAIKYSPEKPEITIQTYNADESLVIAISDKGIGIETQYHKHIFDNYFRVPTGDVHDVKGFGLGLSYVKKMIEFHDGSINLKSQKKEGSTFTIVLPYV